MATFSEIFKPVDNDYGLISLRRVIGCTVDAVWKGTTCADAGMVATAAGVFNVAVAIIASILISYAPSVAVMETASEGEADRTLKYTFIRTGLGALLLLPLSSGWTLAQVLVIQIMVWGSGGADYLWAKVAPKMAGSGYSDIATLPVDDVKIRAALANALRVRTLGYVCADRLNEIAGYYNVSTSAVAAKTLGGAKIASAGGEITTPTRHTFVDGSTTHFFNGSTQLCGYVSYMLPQSVTLPEKKTPTQSADVATMTLMDAIATSAVTSGYTAAWSSVDIYARSIANAIKSPGTYTEQQISDAIAAGVWAAQSALRTALNTAITSRGSEVKAIADQYLTDASSAGWVFAISWQRANVAMAQRFQSLVNGVTFTPKEPDNIAAIIDPASLWSLFSTPRIADAGTRQIVALYQRDMGYLNSFKPVFADMASTSPTLAAEQVGVPDNSAGVSSMMRWVYSKLKVTGTEGSTQWSDPLLDLTQIGVGLVDTGLKALAASAGASLAKDVPVLGRLAELSAPGLGFVGTIFTGAGWWLGGVLPLLPLLYFFGAVLSWLVNGLEALIAVPLWVLTHFYPAREPSLIGASRQGYLLLFGLLARPLLIVMGLVVSLLLMYAAFALLNALFASVWALMIPLDGGPVTSAMVTSGAVFLYVMAATMVVMNSSALMSELGDSALRWVEVGVQSIWGSSFGEKLTSQINPAGRLSGSMERLGGVAGTGTYLRLSKPNKNRD
ncbi:DotA/TraY family protein [Xanthobacter agilis]|uniref:DotA/TraY family protein n=1 Tax=Xanthobacter agilis TaxID=47492 RepID=UPI003729B02F